MAPSAHVLFILKYGDCSDGGFHPVWGSRWSLYCFCKFDQEVSSISNEETDTLRTSMLPIALDSLYSVPSLCLPGTQGSIEAW